MRKILCLAAFSFLLVARAGAQSPNGTMSGLVVDPSGAAIVGADILVANDATGVQYSGKTNGDGIYLVSNLPPGSYRLQVSKIGFKTLIKPDIALHVQDALAINFTLPIGAASETVTVQGGASLVNTTKASVSTVINRQFVENLPLNGRSFNTLLQLTPGVVIAPTVGAVATGQFSIAGQRTDANSFTVDGVSANFGVTPGAASGQSGTGTAQAFSALGGTSGLVSVEALQEFRIETSSFAPEFGSTPGGQVILTTRSGTNNLHGGVFDYFRNTVMDANDWFANQVGLPRAPEHHNDFGAFVGGPIWKNRTFYFLSYEGARLTLPQTMSIDVPSDYARSQAPAALAPLVNAYPKPNGQPASPTAYIAPFTGNYSNSGRLDAGSVRIDHTFDSRFSIFGRYNDAPSQTANRTNGLSELDITGINTKMVTVGFNMQLNDSLLNTLRANYSTQESSLTSGLDSFGGAVPPSTSLLLGSLASSTNVAAYQLNDAQFLDSGLEGRNTTRQLNFVDDVSDVIATHQLRFGGDYRAIFLDARSPGYGAFFDAPSVESFLSSGGVGVLSTFIYRPANILTQTLALYAQDTYAISPRFTATYGLRWQLAPAPSARGTTTLDSWQNINNPADFSLAPSGTPLWATNYANFAPRVGVAYRLSRSGDFVLRAGWGLFYDVGVGQALSMSTAFPNKFSSSAAAATVPISDLTPYLPSTSAQPPYPGIYGFSPDLRLPRSYQWNLALERSIGRQQAISLTYVGQKGQNLLRNTGYWQPNSDFSSYFFLTTNEARSAYNALQIQYRKLLEGGLQALFSYTWSHSLDNSSNDVISSASTVSAANDYASSDFDVRHSFSGAVTYNVPSLAISRPISLFTKGWSVDAIIVARTGFPFNGKVFVESPVLGYAYIRPDVVPGQPYWISTSGAAGGKSLNPAVFVTPPANQQGSEGRNDIPGFGLTQVDLSLGRKFPITERISAELRVDAFNLLNHPNFTNPFGYTQYGSYGLQSQEMLNQGLGGLNPLFQEGGPRSLQVSLRLAF